MKQRRREGDYRGEHPLQPILIWEILASKWEIPDFLKTFSYSEYLKKKELLFFLLTTL